MDVHVVRGRRVVRPDAVGPASVHIGGGTIVRVGDYDDVRDVRSVEDVGDLVLMAGLVDTHVHINEPGRTEWEGFESATRSALAGGVTTVVDMPLNSIPPTTTLAGLLAKASAAEGKLWVDVGFCGGVVPGNRAELGPLIEAGVLGFKCFLTETGVDEFRCVGEDDLAAAMRVLAGRGLPLLVHAELDGPLDAAAKQLGTLSTEDARRFAVFLASRPREAENQAVALVARRAREFGTRAHIVHLSSSDALPIVARARDAGADLTVETCPHYLFFRAEEIPDGATEYKCTPPIREGENREKLWDALRQGAIAQVVTDHSPSTPALKCSGSGDFSAAWGGIASLQLGLPAVWTEAGARGRSVADIAHWMSEAPAQLAGLATRKGSLRPGRDADLVAWDPDAVFTVDARAVHHRHKLTPYAGRTLRGVVHTTWLRGARAYDQGRFEARPAGRWLRGRQEG